MLKVRRHVRFGLSYRDLAELLGGCGIEVVDSTLSRWVQDLTPLLVDASTRPTSRSFRSASVAIRGRTLAHK